MQKWKIAAFAAMTLLILVILGDLAVITHYMLLPRPAYAAPAADSTQPDPSAKQVSDNTEAAPAPPPVKPIVAPAPPMQFPPPPAANGAEKEYWEGYYVYGLASFEQAVAQNFTRVRFWFEVRRTADGNFQAACNELGGGDALIQGVIDRNKGVMQFDKSYANGGLSWRYEGEWSAAAQRINGFYRPPNGGQNQGTFVLYPRRLKPDEIGRYEQRNNEVLIQKGLDVLEGQIELPGQPAPRIQKVDVDVF